MLSGSLTEGPDPFNHWMYLRPHPNLLGKGDDMPWNKSLLLSVSQRYLCAPRAASGPYEFSMDPLFFCEDINLLKHIAFQQSGEFLAIPLISFNPVT